MKKIFIFLFLLTLVLATTSTALAITRPTGLVPCAGPTAQSGLPACGVNSIFELIANIIKFLLFAVAMPLCALAITYGGIQMAMYSTNPGGKEAGKKIIISAVIGLMITLASYLIVDTILTLFTGTSLGALQTQLR